MKYTNTWSLGPLPRQREQSYKHYLDKPDFSDIKFHLFARFTPPYLVLFDHLPLQHFSRAPFDFRGVALQHSQEVCRGHILQKKKKHPPRNQSLLHTAVGMWNELLMVNIYCRAMYKYLHSRHQCSLLELPCKHRCRLACWSVLQGWDCWYRKHDSDFKRGKWKWLTKHLVMMTESRWMTNGSGDNSTVFHARFPFHCRVTVWNNHHHPYLSYCNSSVTVVYVEMKLFFVSCDCRQNKF